MEPFTLAATAALIQTSDPEWNAKVTDWLRCQALSHAYEQMGPLNDAVEKAGRKTFELIREYGPAWKGSVEAKAAYQPFDDEIVAQEAFISREFYEPQTEAAIALALHPAPDLQGALFKLEVMKREELHLYLPMPRPPFEIIAEDMARLNREQK